MSEPIIVPKWLADTLNVYRKVNAITQDKKHIKHKQFMHFIGNSLLLENEEGIDEFDYVLNTYSIEEISKLLVGEYKAEKEYLTLEQVMKLKEHTRVKHLSSKETMYILLGRLMGESGLMFFNAWMLEPKWYVVKEVKTEEGANQ